MQGHVAALKNSMIASQQDLRTYQWVETTTVLVNGEQKSYKEESCYYGAHRGERARAGRHRHRGGADRP